MPQVQPPRDYLDRQYCTCDDCIQEIHALGTLIVDIQRLTTYARREVPPVGVIDLSHVKCLRDMLLCMKPFVTNLEIALRDIQPVEDTNV